jgi:hypothetical protein
MSEQVTEHLAPPTPEDSAAALELLFGCLALGRSFNDMMPAYISFKPENPTEIGNYPADASYTIIGTWTDPQTGAKLGQRHAGDTLLITGNGTY